MNVKIINAESGIASCSGYQVAEDIQNPNTVIFFYYWKRNWIVFNADHPNYDLHLELVQGYMELDDQQRKKFLDQIDTGVVRGEIDSLIRILRIRRKWYRKMKAA